jgi:hypothetical protein
MNILLLIILCMDKRNRRIEHIDSRKKAAFANLGSGAVKNQ